jgi:excisionase family DNA binding protein
MKTELESHEIKAIVKEILPELADALRPHLSGNGKDGDGDVIFDKKGLSKYLKVSVSTINKLVSNKQIPHFKINHGQSGGVRFYKRDIDKWVARHTIPEINEVTAKLRKVRC